MALTLNCCTLQPTTISSNIILQAEMDPKLATRSDSNIIITGRLSFWWNYFLLTPVSLWRSDLEPMGVSSHWCTRSDYIACNWSDGEYENDRSTLISEIRKGVV